MAAHRRSIGGWHLSLVARFGAEGESGFEVQRMDGERILCRGRHPGRDGSGNPVLFVLPAAEHPPPASLERIAHEFGLKDELDGAWAVRPVELLRDRDRTVLVLDDPGGEPLYRRLGAPIEVVSKFDDTGRPIAGGAS